MSNPLLTWLGDDFSGSADVMEALALGGVRTALFLEPPTPQRLARFADLQAVGVAGVSRSMSVTQMDRELPAAFAALRRLGAPLTHYKICSTFDSSPQIGSIGRAIDLGQREFNSPFVPLLVGAPVLGRYCVFGNLFARSGLDSPVHRLDRHPTMSRHPVTPMDESDLRELLGRQTQRRVGLIDTVQISAGADEVARRLADLRAAGAEVILLDIAHDAQLPTLGRLLWEHARRSPLLVVGSSGVEYALAAHWRQTGLIEGPPPVFGAAPAERIVVVSGSCSPVTARQIDYAVERGFGEIAADAAPWVDPDQAAAELPHLAAEVRARLDAGQSVIVHTSKGPDDPRIAATRCALKAAGGAHESAVRLGRTLGRTLRMMIEQAGVRRVAVAGGDTSGYVARELGIEALELAAPVAPGSPLCRVHAVKAGSPVDGVEIVFKGGQVGKVDFLVRVLEGTAPHRQPQPM